MESGFEIKKVKESLLSQVILRKVMSESESKAAANQEL